MHDISYITNTDPFEKIVLLRVDFNLPMGENQTIVDDERMKQAIPTITSLLETKNKLIIVSHLGRPKGRDMKLSTKPLADRLQTYLPKQHIVFIADFQTEKTQIAEALAKNEIVFLENIRFYPEEETNDNEFAKELSSLANVFVNDAFSVSHRKAASIVGVTQFLKSYGGLLLKKEVSMLTKLTDNPKKPFVALLGGSKITTKLALITKLTTIADHVLLSGGLANTVFLAQGKEIGKSIGEKEEISHIENLVLLAKKQSTELVLPIDAVIGEKDATDSSVKRIDELSPNDQILDIGPETQAIFSEYIAQAKTIVWNGPVGYIENPAFSRGTDFIYYAITQNPDAFSVVGGGETLSALKNKDFLNHISHISTGGGAMLEFIENGTLVGLNALKESVSA